MDSKWNTTMMSDGSKPPSENEGETIVEDPVGLLNIYEYTMSYRGTTYDVGYLFNHLSSYLITPYDNSNLYYINYYYDVKTCSTTSIYGIRPSINLNPEIKIVGGNGTEDNPYRLEGDNDTNLEETKLNTRYSGEYIRFGVGENNLYRIVSHETEGLTKVTSAYPLKENNNFKEILFDENRNVNYSNNNTIGTFLNGEYLNSDNYLTNEQVNMIENNTTWYLGNVYFYQSYKLAKYTDTAESTLTSKTTVAKIGLLRYSELMAGQFNSFKINREYYLINPIGNYNLGVYSYGHVSNLGLTNSNAIKPALNLKSNVIITGGDGTKNSPFTLDLAL